MYLSFFISTSDVSRRLWCCCRGGVGEGFLEALSARFKILSYFFLVSSPLPLSPDVARDTGWRACRCLLFLKHHVNLVFFSRRVVWLYVHPSFFPLPLFSISFAQIPPRCHTLTRTDFAACGMGGILSCGITHGISHFFFPIVPSHSSCGHTVGSRKMVNLCILWPCLIITDV